MDVILSFARQPTGIRPQAVRGHADTPVVDLHHRVVTLAYSVYGRLGDIALVLHHVELQIATLDTLGEQVEVAEPRLQVLMLLPLEHLAYAH